MTAHKQRIVDLAFTGLPFPKIAAKLNVEVKTVNVHMHQVYKEYGVHTLMQLHYKMQQESKKSASA